MLQPQLYKIIVENKAVEALCEAHKVQVVNYLTATGLNVGLLFNFGAQKMGSSAGIASIENHYPVLKNKFTSCSSCKSCHFV